MKISTYKSETSTSSEFYTYIRASILTDAVLFDGIETKVNGRETRNLFITTITHSGQR